MIPGIFDTDQEYIFEDYVSRFENEDHFSIPGIFRDGSNVTVTFESGVGAAEMYGGDDVVTVYGHADTLDLGKGDDAATVTGSVGWLRGLDNNEVEIGGTVQNANFGSGQDVLSVGGAHLDFIAEPWAVMIGGISGDIDLGDGDDRFTATGGARYVNAEDGNDIVHLNSFTLELALGRGDDEAILHEGAWAVTGGQGRDAIELHKGAHSVSLGLGADTFDFGSDERAPEPGDRIEELFAGHGADHVDLRGGSVGKVSLGDGNDSLTAHGDVDEVHGGSGHDEIEVAGGTSIFAGDGWDIVHFDIANGPDRDVTIEGGAGHDLLVIDFGDGPGAKAMATGLPIFDIRHRGEDGEMTFKGELTNPVNGATVEVSGFEDLYVQYDDWTILY